MLIRGERSFEGGTQLNISVLEQLCKQDDNWPIYGTEDETTAVILHTKLKKTSFSYFDFSVEICCWPDL